MTYSFTRPSTIKGRTLMDMGLSSTLVPGVHCTEIDLPKEMMWGLAGATDMPV